LSAIDGKIEQRASIKFCVKLSESATKTLEMLCEAFGEHSLSRTAGFECHSRFKACRVSVEDDDRSGRPSTSKMTDVEKIRELIHEDRRRTIYELADTVWISYGVCQEILTKNLNMCRIAPSSQHALPRVPENHRVCDLKGRRFETVPDIQRESHKALDSIKENYFHGTSEAWKKLWDRCIRSQGDYFEGHGSQN
jgi:hypothetical protein